MGIDKIPILCYTNSTKRKEDKIMFGQINTDEIRMLMHKLASANIPYEAREWAGGYQVVYPDYGEDMVCSAIQHLGSYGGRDGYIEIMGLLTAEEEKHDSVKGWLTADEVFRRIEKHFKENT